MQSDIENMDKDFRIQLINSLGGFKSICLIGTKNTDGLTNLGLFNTIFHVGSAPAMYGFISRPSDRERHTLENILQTKQYTINQVHSDFYKKAHQASAKYPREVSEFNMVGLKEGYIEKCIAPFVAESNIKFGLELAETNTLQNKNTIVIGYVRHIIIQNDLIDNDGFISLTKARTIAGSGCDAYYHAFFKERLGYAQP